MQLPARIGKYELEEFLGGGMSHVFRARDTVIGRTVAVKVLTSASCQDADAKERFLAEARMAGNLQHENVLSIHDFGEDAQGHPFMVMEFLRGQTLGGALKSGKAGGIKDKLRIALQLARALGYIHTQNIIHRDIKPENIHISAAGVVKLMDFGIAKAKGLALTHAGYVLGTPYYMAPEQVSGNNITAQVDVYAFGILLFELLTGSKPIQAEAVERIFYRILHERLSLELLHKTGVPEPLCNLIDRCTAKDPAARPQGFGPVCDELERLLAAMDAKANSAQPLPPPVAKPVGRSQWLLPVLMLVAGTLAAGLFFSTGSMREVPDTRAPSGPVSAPVAPPARRVLEQVIETPAGQMLLVAEGPFLFGEKKVSVTLPAYYVDKTAVTNAAYKRFCEETGHPLPREFPRNRQDHPVVWVSIADARDFAKWARKRLPTGQEWEKAARGTDGRTFPWGEEGAAGRTNVGSNGTRPVTDFLNGASPYGVLQIAGNVREWVDEVTTPTAAVLKELASANPPPRADEPWYLVRGLSWRDKTSRLKDVAWESSRVPARWARDYIGFRCVKDPPH